MAAVLRPSHRLKHLRIAEFSQMGSYWDPIQNRAWHDSIWMKPRIGKVDVGAVEQVRTDVPASRVSATAPQVEAAEPQTPEKDEKDLGTQPTP